ncbi:MAG: TetR/AcrR family transcriptional regulator [Acidobacteria bacterium]|nr:TetR/AcrR family transcriptional regulator [Acidobacteriota bacterium]
MRDPARKKTNRDAILDATDQLLAQSGYKKMTIEDLALEVGIGKGSVYLHFESKEDIALSHIDRIIAKLILNLWEIVRGEGSPEQRLRAMLLERVLYRYDRVQHYSLSLDEMLKQLRPRLLERRKKYFENEAKVFAEVLSEGEADGSLDAKDPMETARSLLDATNAFLPYSLSASELGCRDDVERKTKLIADLLLKGLCKRN